MTYRKQQRHTVDGNIPQLSPKCNISMNVVSMQLLAR